MKRLITTAIIAFCTAIGYTQVLDYTMKPVSCSLGDSVYAPFSEVVFTFDTEVTCTMSEFLHAYIYCDGVEVASGNASYSFFSDENRDKTKAVLDISPRPFVPEKGKSYRLHVLPEVFTELTEDFDTIKWNDDIYVDFTVPEDLGTGVASIVNGDTIATIYKIEFTFPTDIKVTNGATITMLCNGDEAGKHTAVTGVATGKVGVYFNYPETLKSGNEYSFILPAGSVSSLYYEDVKNLETRVDFHGGKEYLKIVSCTLEENQMLYNPDILNSIYIHFDQEILIPEVEFTVIKIHLLQNGIRVGDGVVVNRYNDSGKGVAVIRCGYIDSKPMPKGDYQLHIESGTILSKADFSIINDDTFINFTVPDNLGCGISSITDGETVVSAEKITIEFPTEVNVTDETNLELIQEGISKWIPVKADGHNVVAELEETLYFEDGISYTLLLPAGSVSAKYRDDIVNLETSVNFVGGHKSGVENVKAECVSVACVNGLLTVTGVSAGTEIAVFSVDGKAVANKIAGNTTAEIALPAKGIYLVTVNGKSYKVAN